MVFPSETLSEGSSRKEKEEKWEEDPSSNESFQC